MGYFGLLFHLMRSVDYKMISPVLADPQTRLIPTEINISRTNPECMSQLEIETSVLRLLRVRKED